MRRSVHYRMNASIPEKQIASQVSTAVAATRFVELHFCSDLQGYARRYSQRCRALQLFSGLSTRLCYLHDYG